MSHTVAGHTPPLIHLNQVQIDKSKQKTTECGSHNITRVQVQLQDKARISDRAHMFLTLFRVSLLAPAPPYADAQYRTVAWRRICRTWYGTWHVALDWHGVDCQRHAWHARPNGANCAKKFGLKNSGLYQH